MSFSTITSSSACERPSLAKDLYLKAFPRALVDKVDYAISRLCDRIDSPHFVETGPLDRPPSKTDRHKFTLWCGTASSPHVNLPQRLAFREAADMALLSLFGAAHAREIEHNVKFWPELETDRAANPSSFTLQFVGVDEASWTFDQHGCLVLTILQGDELLWYYVKAEVGDDENPLPEGSELPIDRLPEPNQPSDFKKFALTPKKRC